MLHGNLKVKFPVAGGEAIYAAIFFNNRNHADDTNSVIALMGNGDLVLEDRFYGVGVDHINTEAVALFIDLKFDAGIVRVFHLLTGVDAFSNAFPSRLHKSIIWKRVKSVAVIRMSVWILPAEALSA